jgi:predicted CoA-substrate-specific enzyme activase
MQAYLGIDVGSVTTKLAVLNSSDMLVASLYLPTGGRPADAVKEGLCRLRLELPEGVEIKATAVTGSGRHLAASAVGADLVKNEITCQAVAAVHFYPDAQTVVEIGGQDSKIILIRDGLVTDFAMNTVCAAGTGSFLDHQAARLQMTIEELSRRALLGAGDLRISGRCTVFAESDMIHKQQSGYNIDDIISGLCRALVRNFLGDVASGKDIRPPLVFQGGVAFNRGIVKALGEELKMEIVVPRNHEVMGAIGAALLAHENPPHGRANFQGFDMVEKEKVLSPAACVNCRSEAELSNSGSLKKR